MISRIRSTVDSLRGNRIGISPSVDIFLEEHGDEPIQQLVISRNIINPFITGTLNIISPNCGQMATASGYHTYLCGGNSNLRHARHEIVSEGVVQLLRSGGYHPEKNAKVCCLGTKNKALRPADILSDGDRLGSRVCTDITVVSNMCANVPKPYTVGKAALEADNKKYIKHKVACENAGFEFQAFATDTSGVLSPSSYLYLCRIATSYAAIANRPYPYALSLCLRRVSFAIQKGLAYQLTSSPSFMPTITEDVFDLS